MLPIALQVGVPIGSFWKLSLDEIQAIFEAEAEKIKQQRKEKIILLYELADVIGNRVNLVLAGSKEVQLMRAEEQHPELFDLSEEDIAEEERKRIGRMQAESRRSFARKWNPILERKYGSTQTTSSNTSEYKGPEEGDGGSES